MARFWRITAGRRAGVAAVLLIVLAGMISIGSFVRSALAAPAIPAPAITRTMANPTMATTAAFSYTDRAGSAPRPHLSFRCALDSSRFSSCPAGGIRYTGLTGGLHTFAVEAGDGQGSYSLASSYSWRVDASAPAITLTFPVSRHAYSATAWAAGCGSAGICGRAAGRFGVRSVAVGIYQQSSGRYWTGSSFSSRHLRFSSATGTRSWRYTFIPPRAGSYTVYVRATDCLGRTTRPARLIIARFSYETAAPAAPVIVVHPPQFTAYTSAVFAFTDTSWRRLRFSCYLDSGPIRPCTWGSHHHGHSGWHPHRHGVHFAGGMRYANLPAGRHCFYVFATDAAGNVGPAARYCWFIVGRRHTYFTVGGDLPAPLYPGTSEPLDLTFTNPTSAPIFIVSGAVSSRNITIISNKAGCGGSNFAVTQGLTASATVPARQLTPVSLSALGIPQAGWPVITMIDTHTNQDACEGAQLTLAYAGIEAAG